MEMKLATRTQRLLVYLIDYFLPGIIVSSIILPLFYKMINFDTTIANTSLAALKVELEYYLSNSSYDTSAIFHHLTEYLKYFYVDLAFTILFTTIILILYLIVLPKFWNKQTLGRMLIKVKVVKKNGDDLSLKDIILREGVGVILMYVILNNVLGGGIVFASVILAYVDGRSLVDYIAGTCLITQKDEAGVYPNSPFKSSMESNDTIIDANVEEIYNNSNDGKADSDDDYTII